MDRRTSKRSCKPPPHPLPSKAETPKKDDQHQAPSDPELNQCFAEMGDSLSKLKNLAVNMGDELNRQNQVLDRVKPKADKADEEVVALNRTARRLLL